MRIAARSSVEKNGAAKPSTYPLMNTTGMPRSMRVR